MNKELASYIKARRKDGMGDKELLTVLVEAGWPKDLAAKHLHHDVPEPPHPKHGALNAGSYPVEYIIMLLALWASAVSLGMGLYYLTFVTGGYGDGAFSAAATAVLLVSLPIYTFLFFRLKKLEKKQPSLKNNRLRAFGIYAALAVTIVTAAGHIIWSIYSMLGGSNYYGEVQVEEHVVRDIARIAIVLIIAVPIWIYYSRELKGSAE